MITLNQSALKFNFIFGLSFILIIFLVIFYIFQVNAITASMYLIKNYDKKIESISQENKLLEIKFSQANSLENLRSLVENLDLEEVGKVDYIKVPEGTVVIK